MKILDRYILSRFIFNFISSFLIIMVISSSRRYGSMWMNWWGEG